MAYEFEAALSSSTSFDLSPCRGELERLNLVGIWVLDCLARLGRTGSPINRSSRTKPAWRSLAPMRCELSPQNTRPSFLNLQLAPLSPTSRQGCRKGDAKFTAPRCCCAPHALFNCCREAQATSRYSIRRPAAHRRDLSFLRIKTCALIMILIIAHLPGTFPSLSL